MKKVPKSSGGAGTFIAVVVLIVTTWVLAYLSSR